MGKYEFLNQKNIVSVHKKLSLKYEEGYGGTEKTLDAKIYPFTVEERIEIGNMIDEGGRLLKSKSVEDQKRGQEMLKEADDKAVYYTLKKEDPEITMDIVKKMSKEWKTEIFYAALEFEGIKKSDIEKEEKNGLGKI